MSSYFNCAAYSDVDSTIRLSENVIFLALEDKKKNSSVHLTLNPFQVRILAKYLTTALSQINFADLVTEKHFGDLTAQIELNTQTNLNLDYNFYDNDLNYEDEYSVAVPF